MELLGTPYYMAPEIIQGKPYSYEVDIWALGVLVYLLIYGNYPFDGSTKEELYERINENKPMYKAPGRKVTDLCKDFIQKCLTVD